MPDRLFSGLKTAWDVGSMSTTFTGGLHFGPTAAEDTSWPHVTMMDLGNALRFATSGGESSQAEFRNHAFQMTIWWKEDGVTDPILAIGALMRTLDAWMQSHNTTLFRSASEGYVIEVTNADERIMEADDERVWQGQIDYNARRVKNVNA